MPRYDEVFFLIVCKFLNILAAGYGNMNWQKLVQKRIIHGILYSICNLVKMTIAKETKDDLDFSFATLYKKSSVNFQKITENIAFRHSIKKQKF